MLSPWLASSALSIVLPLPDPLKESCMKQFLEKCDSKNCLFFVKNGNSQVFRSSIKVASQITTICD